MTAATGAWAQYPIVYDFEAAANAGETVANKNGSAANGQQFYGWENDTDKKDKARQDYKGYEWAEGSVLPEVCHVWRRSDRFPDNVKIVTINDVEIGGLYCPSNKEMAIDGLTAGLTVTIVYDASGAAEGSKEIVWAIGDGSSAGGPGSPRATATINGVEAKPGKTTIASGAVITVNSVTKADNGSGYIVFAVKKGMIIKQVIIDVAPTYTATFTTDAKWNEVYAYAWSGEDPDLTEILGPWPGTKIEATEGVYNLSFTSASAPEKIVFSNGNTGLGNQTEDFDFVDGQAYQYTAPVTYTVALKEGTEDADNWTIEPTEAEAGTEVTATYSGAKKVKSVKAKKKAAAQN